MTEPTNLDDVTPESLMDRFRGPGFSKMLLVTIVVHLVLIVGTSIPFLLSAFGGGKSELSKDERVANAVSDARSSLETIAEKHGLSPQELSDQFGSKKAAPSTAKTADPAPAAPEPPSPGPEKSAIEKELEAKQPGPDLPAIPTVDDEDLFGDE